MNKTPLVSIVIPVYKGANFVAAAIDSALAQTYKNIEIIVVNDGSLDDGATERVALSYSDKIHYFYKENGGVSTALNYGISKMKGEYFSWLSHDDLYTPDKIEKQVKMITSYKDIIICSGSLMNSEGQHISYYVKVLNKRLNGVELFKAFMHGYTLNGLGFLIPKYVFEEEGYFDESMRYLQDLDMWLRIMWKDYTFVCMPDLLVKSRIHNGQTTNLQASIFHVDRTKMAIKHAELLKVTKVENRIKLLQSYLLLFTKGGNKTGIELIKQLLKDAGCNDRMLIQCIYYKIRGKLKSGQRTMRDALLRIKGSRS